MQEPSEMETGISYISSARANESKEQKGVNGMDEVKGKDCRE